MNRKAAILLGLAVLAAAALVIAGRGRGPEAHLQPQGAPQAAQPEPAADGRVPPYHPSAEAARPLPRTLAPELFTMPAVARAYRIAREIPEVLAQQPCYCWCDKFGHGSLLDCFATEHGAG